MSLVNGLRFQNSPRFGAGESAPADDKAPVQAEAASVHPTPETSAPSDKVEVKAQPETTPPAESPATPKKEKKKLLTRVIDFFKSIPKLFQVDMEARLTRNWEVTQQGLEAEHYLKTKEPTLTISNIEKQIGGVKYEINLLQGLYDRFEKQIVYYQQRLANDLKENSDRKAALKEVQTSLVSLSNTIQGHSEEEQKATLNKIYEDTLAKAVELLDKDLRPASKLLKVSTDASLMEKAFADQNERLEKAYQRLEEYYKPENDKQIEHFRGYQKRYTEDMAPMKEKLAKLEAELDQAKKGLAKIDEEKSKAFEAAKAEYEAGLKALQAAKNPSESKAADTPEAHPEDSKEVV